MSLDSLLRVQTADTTLEQLRHRRESLPERQELALVATERSEVETEISQLDVERGALAKDQRRLEDDVATLEAKIDQEQNKLYGGTVTSPKEAQALQDEIASLQRHQRSLEDRVIDLMEQIEPLSGSLDEYQAKLGELDERQSRAQSSLSANEADIDAAIAAEDKQRADAVVDVRPDDLQRYEAIRAGFGPSTVVEFDGKNCVGCPLAMPAVELDRLKKAEPGTLVECQECGRLVVR